AFDDLPPLLGAAAHKPIGTVLPPISVADLRAAKAFGPPDGPRALRDPDRPPDGVAVTPAAATVPLLLLFRIAGQKVVLRPYSEVRDRIKDQLDTDLFLKAKETFFQNLKQNITVSPPQGTYPPISPYLLNLAQWRKPADASSPPPSPEHGFRHLPPLDQP
ncbi:MAG: hypothetical protein ACREJ2_17135, partial [Planctomycetota bacterium]